MTPGLADRLRARGRELGFEEVSFAAAGPAPRADAFRRWLDRGHAGEMSWLADDPEGRIDPRRRSPWAKTIISAAMSYAPAEAQVRNEAGRGGIVPLVARYALGRDYHDVMKEKLGELASFLRAESGGRAEARTLVDTSAVLEREYAAAGGLGWTGKNTMQILERGGSYVFLGEILTDVEIVPGAPVEDRCGSCTRCIEACPTGAILDAGVLDARRCISYLTIELRGSLSAGQREAVGQHLFGCDICQEVCPWNADPSPAKVGDLRPVPGLLETTLAQAVALGEEAFRDRFRGTALFRTKRSGFVRNALLVAANGGDSAALRAGAGALEDPDPVVRETAVWALARGESRERRAAALAADREPDPVLKRAMREALPRER